MLLAPEANAAAEALFAADRGQRIGPFVLGFFLDSILVGIVIMMFIQWQMWSSSQETKIVKILAYYLVLHAAGYTAYMVATHMRILAFYYGEWAIFFDKSYVRWTYLFETIARTPVSIFFAARAYKLGGRSKIFVAVVAPLFLTSVAGAIWARVSYEQLYTTSRGMIPVYLWISAEVLSDLIITGFIAYHLITSRTGWKQTDKMITKLIVMAIETQLPPTIAATVFLFIAAINPHTMIGAFFAWLPNAYIISLFVVLNKRLALRREMDHETATYRTRGKETYGLRIKKGVQPAGNIQVTTETVRHVDEAALSDASDMDKHSTAPEEHLQVLNFSTSETRLTNPEK